MADGDGFDIDINLVPHLLGEETLLQAVDNVVMRIRAALEAAGAGPGAAGAATSSYQQAREDVKNAPRPAGVTPEEQRRDRAAALAALPLSVQAGPPGSGAYSEQMDVGKGRNAKLLSAQQELAAEVKAEVNAIRKSIDRIRARNEADTGYIQAQVALTVEKQIEKALIQKGLSVETDYIKARADAAAAQKSINARAKAGADKQLAKDEDFLQANADSSRLKKEMAARQLLIESGDPEAFDLQGDELLTRAAVNKRVGALERQAAELNAMTSADMQAEARARVAKSKATAAQEAQTRQIIRQMTQNGELGGTTFQRVQSRLGGSQKAPTDYQPLGQLFASRAITTASYGLAGAVTYGAVQGIGTLLEDAQVLEQRFVRIRAQLEAFGEAGSFAQVKQEILDVASATGQAGDEVGETFQRFRGAFGTTAAALEETEAAMKLVTVTGGDVNSMIEDGIAANSAWGVSMQELGDQILSLSEKTGVDADSLQRFVGETAAAASAAGLSLQQTAIIGATAAQELGKAPDQVAEPFTRILTQISGVKEQILAIYQTTPGLAKNLDKVIESFSNGDTGLVLTQIIEDFKSLTTAEQDDIITRLGARKDSPFLTGLLRDSEALTEALKGNDQGAGTLNARFATVEGTLKNVGQRLSQMAKELGDALLQAGLGDLFEKIGIGIAAVVKGITLLLGLFTKLDQVTGFVSDLLANITGIGELDGIFDGVLSTFAQMAIIAALATKAISFTRESLLGLGKAGVESEVALAKDSTAASSARKTRALAAETEATVINSGANRANAASEVGTASAKDAATAATTRQSAATVNFTSMTAAANAAQIKTAAGLADDIPTVIPLPRDGLRNRLGNAGTSFAGSARGSALLKNGRYLTSSTANATAAASGASASASGAGIAGLIAAGVIVVGQSYAGKRGEVESQSNSLQDSIKTSETKALESVRDGLKARSSGLQDFSVWFFGQENPLETIEKELTARESAAGQKNITDVVSTDKLDSLISQVTDDNLSQIQNILNSSDETKKAFEIAGGELDESAADRAKNVLAAIPGADSATSEGVVNDLTREELKKALPGLVEKAKEGDEGASRAVREINDLLGTNAEIREIIAAANLKGDTNAAIEAAGGGGAYAALTADESKNQLEAGRISLASHIKNVEAAIAVGRPAAGTREEKEKIDKLEADFQKTLDKRVLDLAQNSAAVQVAAGDSTQTDADIAALEAVLADERVSGTAKLELLPDLLAKTKDKFNKDLENIKDPIERFNMAMAGAPVNPALAQALVAQQLADNDQAAQQIDKVATATGVRYDNLNQDIAQLIATTDKSLKEITLEIIDEKINALAKLIAFGQGGEDGAAKLAELKTLRDEIANAPEIAVDEIGILGPDADAVDANNKKLATDLRAKANADGEMAKAIAGGDGVAVAAAVLNQLQAELAALLADPKHDPNEAKSLAAQIINAQRDLNNAARSLGLAQLQLAAAYAQNPVAQAQAAQQIALYEIQTARMNNDREGVLAAQAQLVGANQAAADAQNDIIRSQIELAGAGSRDPASQAAVALQLAQFDLAVAESKGDVAAANRARIQIMAAQEQAAGAAIDLMSARLDLLAAGTEDPVKLAQIAQQQADLAAQNATTEAERIQAQIQRINADRQMRDAIVAIMDAQTELGIAIADAAGDTVKAAQLGLEQARRALQQAISSGAGDAAILQAQANVVRSEAQVRQAQFDDRLGDIEFAAQIGDITTAQQIEMLKALAQIPGNTEDQVRQIRLKIKELQNQLSSDFQFNLPTDILPTFYESRRLTQANEQGIGYQDNRNVVVSIAVNGTDNPTAVANQVVAIIAGAGGGGPQNAPNPGRY